VLRVPAGRILLIIVDRFRLEGTSARVGGTSRAHLEGLQITIPPGEDKPELPPVRSSTAAGLTACMDSIASRHTMPSFTILRRNPRTQRFVLPRSCPHAHGVGRSPILSRQAHQPRAEGLRG